MDCPRCSVELITMKLGKTEINGCPLCGGLLLDHGELDRVAVPHDGDLEYSTLDDESFFHDDAQQARFVFHVASAERLAVRHVDVAVRGDSEPKRSGDAGVGRGVTVDLGSGIRQGLQCRRDVVCHCDVVNLIIRR